ncbi:hypothetical protein HYH03_003395 [Edaphochlamys debaryana]|uniref:Uncharacterized protein n=1 Tax=Edaphochlamys debaryana TaxID=47281 RepID=A0A835YJ72_9CHLO|nr:hypothetical protein HYH03_003395 [Edaphochlamys debaryana]|eukprot:KAG2498649.1 hypothetical protein HYH03_003395 [Edaphochlamys debaryana]
MVVATAAQPRDAHGRAAGAVGATEAPACSVERAWLWVAAGNVTDWPRVARRALLWDSTKATYLPRTPMEVVETMASSKLNVLYWLPLRAGVPEDTQREIMEQAALRGIHVVMLSWAQPMSAADYEAAAAGRADPQNDDPILSYYDSDPDTDPLLDEEEREEAKELLEAEVVARDLVRRRLLFLDFLFGGGKDKGAQGAGDGEGRRMGGSGVRRSGGAGRSLIRGGGGGGAGYGDGEGAGGRKMVKKKKKMMKKKMKKKRKVLPSTGGGDDSFSDDDEDRERSSAQDLYRRRALLGQRLRYDQADDAEDAVDLEGEPYIQPAARGIRARASAVAATAAALRSESGYGSKAGARGAIRGPVSSSTQALDLLRAAGQAVVALDDIDGLLGAWPGVAVGAERLWASQEDGGVVEEEWTRPASAVVRLSVHRCRMGARGVEVWRLGPLGPCPGEEAD